MTRSTATAVIRPTVTDRTGIGLFPRNGHGYVVGRTSSGAMILVHWGDCRRSGTGPAAARREACCEEVVVCTSPGSTGPLVGHARECCPIGARAIQRQQLG